MAAQPRQGSSRLICFPFATLLCNLDFPAPEVGLLDVLDAEVGVALRVLLLLVPGGGLIVGAVRVRRGWDEKQNETKKYEIKEPIKTRGTQIVTPRQPQIAESHSSFIPPTKQCINNIA